VKPFHALVGAILTGLGLTFAVAAIPSKDDASFYYTADNGLACVGCHGIAGEGGGEGGISIPAIAGRVGPGRAYPSQTHFCNLLATGRLADGRRLSNLMPRYALTAAQCGGLYRFAASLSQPVFAAGDAEFGIVTVADPRSKGQLDWQKQIADRLRRANEAGGIYGRNFIVNASTARPLLTIDLTRSTAVSQSAMPTILLQADGKSPLIKAIESSVFDEVTAVVATYPGEKVLIIDPLAKGPKLEALKAVVEQGTELFSSGDCGTTPMDHVVIISLTTDPDLGLGPLTKCKGSRTAAFSLRNVRAETIASAAKSGLLPSSIFVFTPVPTGEQFAKIPETIAEIIIDMARRMGANPDRAAHIQAFDVAWRSEGRGDAALFSGASLVQVNPLTMLAIDTPVWRDAP
jgi:hypothetical protein